MIKSPNLSTILDELNAAIRKIDDMEKRLTQKEEMLTKIIESFTRDMEM